MVLQQGKHSNTAALYDVMLIAGVALHTQVALLREQKAQQALRDKMTGMEREGARHADWQGKKVRRSSKGRNEQTGEYKEQKKMN